jgi:predicted Zn finger-like uncharacterized protein
MKIACDSCGAKYTIADEKVAGKTVKIRCKKCGATMVIDGHAAPSAAAHSSIAPSAAIEAVGGWMLHTGEGDQETLSVEQIVERYRDGRLDGSAYVWREGMTDWKLLRDVPELFSVCVSSVGTVGAPAKAPPAAASRPVESARRASAPPPSMPIDSAPIGDDESTVAREIPSPRVVTEPVAVPRASSRGPLADLVASSATASSAPQAPSALTGQRNDNSVLFSLASLSKSGPGGNAPTAPGSDASGLIDMRALAAVAPKPAVASAPKVDDIMNLSSGGLFGGGAVSPVMTQTYQAVQAPLGGSAAAGGGVSGKTLAFAVAGGVLFVLVAVGAVVVAMKKSPDAAVAAPAATAMVAEAPKAADVATPAPAPASPAPAPATALGKTPEPPKAAPDAPKAPKPVTSAPAYAPTSKGGVSSSAAAAALFGPGGAASRPAPAPVAVAKPVGAASAASLESAMSAAATKPAPSAAPKPAAPAAASGPAFDRGAASAELRRIADAVASCRKSSGPTGDGHVSIAFRNDGTVDHVDVDRPPYQGSPVGACVATKFKLARIPAFGGTIPPVGKSFTID